MEKRYQVFVSSTYADLKEERQQVLQTLMEMDCIPSGMEMFPATDEEQWEFIKKVIDDCDYYLLIIGGRYGSLSSDGISYTEKEYRYAVEKGIKVIAFLHQSPDELAVVKTDIDPDLMAKLKEFRENVATGRLVRFWNHANELPGLVALSLTKTIKMYPAIGWIRASSQSSAESLGEINELRKENDRLRKSLENLESAPKFSLPNLADYSESIELSGTYKRQYDGSSYNWKTEMTWSEIFGAISPYLLEHPSDGTVKLKLKQNAFKKLNQNSYSSELDDQVFQTVKMQLMALGLVDVSYSKTTKGGMGLFWRITESGKALMLKLRTITSNNT
ncbi:DUF4062 domain-containing protein [Vibrio parahaemolyticus]|uniref:DUF4062 domain-containing protein n=1 Tax=Vibrio parahaemolyticus TaxID=670 RepID=UPI001C7C8BB3|nr:DUF4062 domain-containing protein [Vibrio parahaemolyticus]EHR0228810.1 DUF4062 domain-containing protein [Vibrio parahaemolyticus]MCR9955524.1 DUF4062 domain-containing protein [Vibrio parahaemolyticus]HBI3713954.1 DUF4062 domain-containing protein [Vibrio parahaemolyticus]HCG5944464.1 DUF4062 domain-containing protein [Vibrio parahaemolyticus]